MKEKQWTVLGIVSENDATRPSPDCLSKVYSHFFLIVACVAPPCCCPCFQFLKLIMAVNMFQSELDGQDQSMPFSLSELLHKMKEAWLKTGWTNALSRLNL